MKIAIGIIIVFYLSSTAAYVAYLLRQKDYIYKTGFYILFAGFLCHSVLIGYDFAKTGRFPVHNLQETLLLAGWAVAGVFLIFQYKFNLKILGIYAAPLASIIMIAASQLSETAVPVKNIIFSNFWIILHVMLILMGEAAFALACGVGILYLLQEHAIKTKNHGFLFKRLPSLELLDNTGYGCSAYLCGYDELV